jgi:acyl-CoA synthetase (NDP forming)
MHPNLIKLVAPRSIAVVGANDKGNSGARAIKEARALGFSGPIYPVNPNYESIQGLHCYPSLSALPEVPDIAIASVPGKSALAVLADGEAAGVGSMIFFSGGFTDAGTEQGHRRHSDMMTIAARTGMAIAGPNCMGLLSLKRKFNASFVSTPGPLKTGDISIVSQSGGLINAFVELGFCRDIGFNYLISAGNEAVVQTADYLEWLAEDPDTKVIISALESVKDGPRYRTALAHACRQKPVIVLKLGRSEAGKQAAIAHTGSLAGSDEVFRAVCTESGAILVETLDEALETAALFATVPLPRGGKAVIFSSSGGATVLATDIATRIGLQFPALSETTNIEMRRIFEASRPFLNPFDVGSLPLMAKGDNMTRCLETLLADDMVDLIACVMIIQRDLQPRRTALFDQVRAVAAKATKPILFIPETTLHWRDKPQDTGAYISASLQDGLIAIRNLIAYAAFRQQTIANRPEHARSEVPLQAPADGRHVLTEYESKCVLDAAGMPVTRETLVQSAKQAAEAAQQIGFPVALKLQSPDLMHKTEAGALILGLGDEAAVHDAYLRLESASVDRAWRIDGILVQEMVEGGIEFLLGMKRDPIFGPIIVFSLGGIFVDLLGEAAQVFLPSASANEVDALLDQPVIAKLLAGFRGKPPVDRTALADLIRTFAAFAQRIDGRVVAIDLNPVVALPDGVKIVDAAIEFLRDGGVKP